MSSRAAVFIKIALLAIAIKTLTAGLNNPAYAGSLFPSQPAFITAGGERANPPGGWAEFCARYASECDIEPSTPQNIIITRETWRTINDVNAWVNAHIVPMTDKAHWGRANVWSYAEDGRGDCKDYVLLKRRKLIEAGLPRGALLITIVWTQQNEGHAVLIARTDRGDFVLDDMSSKVSVWYDTGYEFVKRQSQSDPNAWVYVDDGTSAGNNWMAHGLF